MAIKRKKVKKSAEQLVTRDMLEVMVKQVDFLFQVTLQQKHEIQHLQLAVLSLKKPFKARAIIDGKMVQYENGQQVSEVAL